MRNREKLLVGLLLVATALMAAVLLKACGQDSKTQSEPEQATTVFSVSTAGVKLDPVTTLSQEVESPTEETKAYTYIKAIPLSAELQAVMQRACEEYGVPYALALGVAECESSFRLEADSGTCWGVMQIHPINYARLREHGIEPTEYEGNIVAGVFMLGELLDKYSDTHSALMAYNCGETGAARLWKQGYTTSGYSRKVVAAMEKWQQIINDN